MSRATESSQSPDEVLPCVLPDSKITNGYLLRHELHGIMAPPPGPPVPFTQELISNGGTEGTLFNKGSKRTLSSPPIPSMATFLILTISRAPPVVATPLTNPTMLPSQPFTPPPVTLASLTSTSLGFHLVPLSPLLQKATPEGTVAWILTVSGIIIAVLIITIIILIRHLRRSRIAALELSAHPPAMSSIRDPEGWAEVREAMGATSKRRSGSVYREPSRRQSFADGVITSRDGRISDNPRLSCARAGNSTRSGRDRNRGSTRSTLDEGHTENIFERQPRVMSWGLSSESSIVDTQAFPMPPDMEGYSFVEGDRGNRNIPRLSLPKSEYKPHGHRAHRDFIKYPGSRFAGYPPSSYHISVMTEYTDTVRSASPSTGLSNLSRNQTLKSVHSFRSAYDPYYWKSGDRVSRPIEVAPTEV